MNELLTTFPDDAPPIVEIASKQVCIAEIQANMSDLEAERDTARKEAAALAQQLEDMRSWPHCEDCNFPLMDQGYGRGKTCLLCDVTTQRDAAPAQVEALKAEVAKLNEWREADAHKRRQLADEKSEAVSHVIAIREKVEALQAQLAEAEAEHNRALIASAYVHEERTREWLAELVAARATHAALRKERDEWRTQNELSTTAATEAIERVAELEQALGQAFAVDKPWPLLDALQTMRAAVVHLLDAHDCDTHGHEQFRRALNETTDAMPRLHYLLARAALHPSPPLPAPPQ